MVRVIGMIRSPPPSWRSVSAGPKPVGMKVVSVDSHSIFPHRETNWCESRGCKPAAKIVILL
jgi:hypothetical protein